MTTSSQPIYASLTSSAVQAQWKVPTAFPACPDEFTDDGLLLYESRPAFGSIFARNHFSTSLVVHHRLLEDGLIVLTRFANDDAVKPWAVAHVSLLENHYCHRSEATFFELQGALKHFCELTGVPFAESIDDYS